VAGQRHEGARIVDFLADLANKPERLQEFNKDPYAMLERSGLNDRQKAILRSHDLNKIRAAIQYEADVPDEAMWLCISPGFWLHGFERGD
jgi:hypothetical protein